MVHLSFCGPLVTTSSNPTSKDSSAADLRPAINSSYHGEDRTRVAKRQQVVTRALVATYHYRCPRSRDTSRTFIWQAKYKHGDGRERLTLQSLRNIDSWSKIQVVQNQFSAFWYHTYCTEIDNKVCSYAFHGYTTGSFAVTGISMELVEYSNIRAVMPGVEEHCMVAVPGPGSCPAYEPQAEVSCVMNHIDIIVAH